MLKLQIILGIAVYVLASSCTVGPVYESPTLSNGTPDSWHQSVRHQFSKEHNQNNVWWEQFHDPTLIALIKEAQVQNLSLRVAVSNLRQARASYGVAASQFVPDVRANGSVNREQSSDNSPSFANISTIKARPVNDFSVRLDASWEVDLWGGIEKSVEAASASFDAELEQYRDALISLRAEVASCYVNIRMLQVKLELVKRFTKSLKELLILVEKQYDQGTISMANLEQERAAYDQGLTQLPSVEMSLQQEYARLALLLGTDIQKLSSKLSNLGPVPRANPIVAVGVPAELLRRRPDIRNAERLLAAQTALVGTKMSNLYPKLSLSGAFGYEATESSDLIEWTSRTYTFGPSLSWDIFNGDRIQSQVQMQEEKAHEAYLNWELTVLQAFSEVENGMSNLIYSGVIQESLNDASRSLFTSFQLTEQEYEVGTIPLQSVLQAEQTYLNAQIALVEQTSNVTQNLITLYKALGGDWEHGPAPDVQAIHSTSTEHVRRTQ